MWSGQMTRLNIRKASIIWGGGEDQALSEEPCKPWLALMIWTLNHLTSSRSGTRQAEGPDPRHARA